MDESQDFYFDGSWPVSTLDGEPSIAEGSLMVTVEPDGGALLTGSIGPTGAPPEECEHFQYSLSAQEARRLGAILSNRP